MRVLVTGNKGFIGGYITHALQEAGHEVIGIDLPEVDITQPLKPIPDLDAVIHLAAVSHPRDCDNNPNKAFDVNVNGTHQVLKMALESGAKKVVFSSSAHVYGISPRYLPTPESHPLWLQNNYTLTKILGEQLCHLYYENHGLSYTALRLFNAYGPGQATGYFIPDFILKSKGDHLSLAGGNTTKDFVYVEDVARAFALALETSYVGAINIGTGIETDLQTIVQAIAHETGASYGITYDVKATRMCADISRAKQVLGWNPTKTINEGLEAIFQYEGMKVKA